MKMSGRKRKRTLTKDNGAHRVKRKKKAEGHKSSPGKQSSVELIDLSDSERNTSSSRQKNSTEGHKASQELRIQKNLRSNCIEINGKFINQFLEENVQTWEEIGYQENPNQIFLSEDFDLDDSDDTESTTAASKNSGSTIGIEKSEETFGESVVLNSRSELANDVDKLDKFFGISKKIRIRCSKCKINLENVADNYLRYVRICSDCQSPILFQCRNCKMIYRHFQSIWDHVERSCQPMEISPSIIELALKAADERSEQNVITLDSDNENEKTKDDPVSLPILVPIRIKSIESLRNVENESTDAQPVANEKTAPKKRPTRKKKTKKKVIATSSASKNSKQKDVDHKCDKCEFKTKSDNEMKNHIANMHSESNGRNEYCTRCRNSFRSLKKHQPKCCGKSVFPYNCKFCEQNFEVLSTIKNHLITKHSELCKWHEMDGILMEIKLKRKAAKEMFLKDSNEKIIEEKELKDSEEVTKNVDDKIAKLSKINEFLRIRCCKCKITFEKVEEKIILRCPQCQSELLYRCRLCDKFFAFFDEAWLHISYKCKFLDTNKMNNTQLASKEILQPPRPTYSCSQCDYTTIHAWQINRHAMWHSYANEDQQIDFTACSRCGLTFEKPEDCKTHEELQCGKEEVLVCEFCPRVARRDDYMRMHLVNMHSRYFGSISHLENIMDVIKMKRKTARGIDALPVSNQQLDSSVKVEEV